MLHGYDKKNTQAAPKKAGFVKKFVKGAAICTGTAIGAVAGVELGFLAGQMAESDANFIATAVKRAIKPEIVTKGHLLWKQEFRVHPLTGELIPLETR